jgi:hypothetical protein
VDPRAGNVNGDGKVDFEIHINVAKLLAHDFLLSSGNGGGIRL